MADDNSTSPTPPQAPPLSISSIFIIAYLSLLVVTALSGNGLLVTVIIKRRLLQKVHYYFILSLASSDFLNALLKIPTTILGRFDRNWYPSYTVCYFTTPLGVLFGAASVLSLSAVAINRYLVISSPLDYSDRMPPVLAKIILAVIWFASFCLAIPPVMWREKEAICRSGKISKEHYTSEVLYFFLALWLFVIIIPSIVMSVSYVKIFLIARYHALQIDSQNQTTSVSQQSKRRRKDLKAAVVLAVIGGIFILCWFPFFVVQTVHKFGKGKISPIYFNIFLCVMYTNSALDPVLLFLFNAEIRKALVLLYCRTFQKTSPQVTQSELSSFLAKPGNEETTNFPSHNASLT